jgi:hypothetical protein
VERAGIVAPPQFWLRSCDQSLAERRSKVVGGAVVSGADGGNEAGDSGGLFDVPRLWIVETLARDEQQERQAARQRERSA